MDADLDTELLRRIAEERDEQAFAEFFKRHSGSAYSVACHVTHDPGLAEESVQEAMLSIWKVADRFVEGSPRSWVLRIVVNKSLNLLRNERRRKAQVDLIKRVPSPSSPPAIEERERQGLLKTLHQQLQKLPTNDQRLLALYYGGGLSQQEIARESNVSQSAISQRIGQALERLRALLKVEGYAAPAIVALPSALPEAFQCGHAVPPGLETRILAKVLKVSLRSASTRSPVLPGISAIQWAALLLLPLLAVAGYQSWRSRETTSPENPSGFSGVAPTGGAETATILARYDFTSGYPDKMKVLAGTWQIDEAGLRTPLALPGGYLDIPVVAPLEPFEVTAEGKILQNSNVDIAAGWCTESEYLPAEWKESGTLLKLKKESNVVYRALFNGAYRIDYVNGTMVRVYRYSQPYPSRRLFLKGIGMLLRAVTVRCGVRPSGIETTPEEILPAIHYSTADSQMRSWSEIPSEPMVLSASGIVYSEKGRSSLDPFGLQQGSALEGEPVQAQWRLINEKNISREGHPGASPADPTGKEPVLSLKSYEGDELVLEISNVRKRPFELEAVVKTRVEGKASVNCRWGSPDRAIPYKIWPFKASSGLGQMTHGTETHWVKFYFVDNFIAMIRENKEKAYVMEYRWPYEGDRVYICAENLWLTHLAYREHTPDDLPGPMRAARSFINVPGVEPLLYTPSRKGESGLQKLNLD